MKRTHLLLALLLSTGCAREHHESTAQSSDDPAPADAGTESGPAESGLLPTPFTAEAIRAECMPGTQLVLAIEQAGQPPVRQFLRFTGGDAENARFETWIESPEGEELGPHNESATPWTELRDHALLPAGSTRERASVTVPFGTYEGWHYMEPIQDDGADGVRHYWFADRFPGPPLRMTEVFGDETRLKLEMIARALP